MTQQIERVPESINFSEEEVKILKLWKELDAFKTCLKQSKGKPRYSFYDGPPFATGLPHYGHILAGTIKDVVTRYAHQQGFHVERRFGWDTHGLPVEYEIDKKLGITSPADVLKMGIGSYNNECRKIVMRYANDWETIIGRMGRWIDFKNDYKTLYPWFMESVWWVFKQLFSKGMVYQGVKVMPFSTACSTPLSNFESGQNYKDVVDPAVVISFPIVGDADNTSFLAWTTTPWTLPSNLTLCVNSNLIYVKVKEVATGRLYILMEARLDYVFKQSSDYEILEKFPGSKLKGIKYEPLFPYFTYMEERGAFRVQTDDYVSAESGTGIVHQAPYFGEDDFRVCLAAKIITRDQEPICPVDESGVFTSPVEDFKGLYVKDADKVIIAFLTKRKRVFSNSQVKHSYPFCWRSDTPLIYKAVPSWFIRVEYMTENLLKTCASTYWVPEFVKEKRFGNWLKEVRDWAVSRNRYWGTPIPIWMSPDGEEIICVGSISELETLTQTKVTDLHRESIDHLEIPSQRPGKPNLKRVSEVFDCWFESGSMPYAQQHYPFENQKEFEQCFPADFIAEGIDQTRGWFYTLLVISTALFDKPPFKNVVANGLVLASDGQKMSKRKQNYPDPMEIVEKYGADALRLYLINSPVVRAENLKFKEEGVRDVIKDVFLPWYNAFRFLMQNVEYFVQENKETFTYHDNVGESLELYTNIMDRWILSFTQSLIEYVRKEMKLYHLYNVVPRLAKFIDHLTNWYVRMNRKRLKGENGVQDTRNALTTLFNVLYNIVKLMAPFTPFFTEYLYQYIKKLTVDSDAGSVHYLMLPQANEALIDKNIERSVSRMQSVIELGRVVRDRKTLPMKYPLPEIIVIHQDSQYLEDIASLQSYVLSELNVRKLTLTTDKKKYGVSLRAAPDHKVLGAKLKSDFARVKDALEALTDSQIHDFVNAGFIDIGKIRVDVSETRLIFKFDNATSRYEAHGDNDVLILLDVTADDSLKDEGIAREVINRIQKLRKKAHLVPTDEIAVHYKTAGDLQRICEEYREFIEGAIKASFKTNTNLQQLHNIIITDSPAIQEHKISLTLTSPNNVGKATVKNKNNKNSLPIKWANLQLHGLTPRYCNKNVGMVLLESNGKAVTLQRLRNDIAVIFGLFGIKFTLWSAGRRLVSDEDVTKAAGQTVFILPEDRDIKPPNFESSGPVCKFRVNGSRVVLLENPKGEPTNV